MNVKGKKPQTYKVGKSVYSMVFFSISVSELSPLYKSQENREYEAVVNTTRRGLPVTMTT